MSKADEMFEKLGYYKDEGLYEIQYTSRDNQITFDKRNNTIIILSDDYDDKINVQELQAINEKVKELGWIDYTTKRDLEYADNPITP